MTNHVLVIGATLLDTKGKPTDGLDTGTSNPGHIRSARGGSARNVAENLARLGADVILITAIGDDPVGKELLAQTEEAGVNVEHAIISPHRRTGAYIALLENDGSLAVAIDDVGVMETITPNYLNQRRSLFRDASIIMMDGSLTPKTMKTIARLAAKYKTPLCADPSSARLTHRLRPYLSQLSLVVPNEVEAAALCEADLNDPAPDGNADLARLLIQRGVENVAITRPDFGLDYATMDETGYIQPTYTDKVDNTGTGDAVTAAIIFGMINDLPIIESIRLGATAATLTLQTGETVIPDLSLDMLYDHLIV